MNRRTFGAMLTTATVSLGGVGSVAGETAAQSTEPLRIEDVSLSLGGVTTTVDRATFSFDGGTITFQVRGWTMEGRGRSLSIDRTAVVVEDADADTYAALRAAMVKSYRRRSPSPLLSALAATDVDDDSPLRVSLGPVAVDGMRAADRVTATGTVGSVVPDGSRDLLTGGASVSQVLGLGPARWERLRVRLGDNQLTLDGVTMQLDGASFVVTASGGRANARGRSFRLGAVDLTILPPETIPAPHVEFASNVRTLAKQGKLTLSAIESAAADAGVTVANTAKAVRNARFTLTLEEVIEDGEAIVADFETSGTLAELLAVLKGEADLQEREAPPAEEEQPPAETGRRIIEVTSDTGEFFEYSFRTSGTIEQVDPEPDTGRAVDEITEVDGGFRVDGAVGTGVDRFVVEGRLTPIDVPDPVNIEVIRDL